jgi:hypothetical protein
MELSERIVDSNLEESGVWMDYYDGSRIKVASVRSKRFRETKERIEKPYERLIRRDILPKDKKEELEARTIAEGLLIDWEGFLNHGEELPYSKEMAYKLVKSQSWFRLDILTMAADEAAYRKEDVEEVAKNLQAGSNGD